MGKSKIETIVEDMTEAMMPPEGSDGIGQIVITLHGKANLEYQFMTTTLLIQERIKSILGPLAREGINNVQVHGARYSTQRFQSLGIYILHPTLGWVRYLEEQERTAGEIVFLN